MLNFNYIVVIVSTFIPVLFAKIWFSESTRSFFMLAPLNRKNDSSNKSILFYAIIILLSLFFSISMHFQVIHQFHFKSMFLDEVGFNESQGSAFKAFEYIMDSYGDKFRTYGHGLFHGLLNAIFIVLPILFLFKIEFNFTKKALLYYWLYFALTMMIVGSIICHFT
jgi:hypothetical protein